MDEVSTEKLMQDLRTVVADAEALLKATAGQAGEKMAEVRARAEESVRAARASLEQAGVAVAARARATAREAEEYVQDNPWTSIGIAAGVGFLIGYLIGRR
jgi:ElaB/YqjD/DUF883 family membrane-anchored ribosome-binding protein